MKVSYRNGISLSKIWWLMICWILWRRGIANHVSQEIKGIVNLEDDLLFLRLKDLIVINLLRDN